jgi:hypothetical protein
VSCSPPLCARESFNWVFNCLLTEMASRQEKGKTPGHPARGTKCPEEPSRLDDRGTYYITNNNYHNYKCSIGEICNNRYQTAYQGTGPGPDDAGPSEPKGRGSFAKGRGLRAEADEDGCQDMQTGEKGDEEGDLGDNLDQNTGSVRCGSRVPSLGQLLVESRRQAPTRLQRLKLFSDKIGPTRMGPLHETYASLANFKDHVQFDYSASDSAESLRYEQTRFNMFLQEKNWVFMDCMQPEPAAVEAGRDQAESSRVNPVSVTHTHEGRALFPREGEELKKTHIFLVPGDDFVLSSSDGRQLTVRRQAFSGAKSRGFMYTGTANGDVEHAVRWMRYFFAFLKALQDVLRLDQGNPYSFDNEPFVESVERWSWEGLVLTLANEIGFDDGQEQTLNQMQDTRRNAILWREEADLIRAELQQIGAFHNAMESYGVCADAKEFTESLREATRSNLCRDARTRWKEFLPTAAGLGQNNLSGVGLPASYLARCRPPEDDMRVLRVLSLEESLFLAEKRKEGKQALGQLLHMLPSFHELRQATVGSKSRRLKQYHWGILGLAELVDALLLEDNAVRRRGIDVAMSNRSTHEHIEALGQGPAPSTAKLTGEKRGRERAMEAPVALTSDRPTTSTSGASARSGDLAQLHEALALHISPTAIRQTAEIWDNPDLYINLGDD